MCQEAERNGLNNVVVFVSKRYVANHLGPKRFHTFKQCAIEGIKKYIKFVLSSLSHYQSAEEVRDPPMHSLRCMFTVDVILKLNGHRVCIIC